MTCIAALVHDGAVYMAGDSAVTNSSWDIVTSSTPKVFRRSNILIGVAGRSRVLNLVEHAFSPPGMPCGDAMQYVVTDFIDAFRELLKNAGHMGQDEGRDKLEGGLLLGIGGRIIEVGNDFYTCEGRGDYFAIGDGDDLAMGSLFSTTGRIADPVERLMLALRAAEYHKASVRRPFTVLGPGIDSEREGDSCHAAQDPCPQASRRHDAEGCPPRDCHTASADSNGPILRHGQTEDQGREAGCRQGPQAEVQGQVIPRVPGLRGRATTG